MFKETFKKVPTKLKSYLLSTCQDKARRVDDLGILWPQYVTDGGVRKRQEIPRSPSAPSGGSGRLGKWERASLRWFRSSWQVRKWWNRKAHLIMPWSRRLFFLTFTLAISPVAKADVVTTEEKPQEVILIIYPEGQALVREKRSAVLIQGSNKLLIRSIPRDVDQGSVLLKPLSSNTSIQFIEYSFQSDQISRKSLLAGSIGLDVQLLPETFNQPIQSVRLLAVDNSEAVLETSTGIQVVDSKRVAFHQIPYRLTQHPLMTIKLYSSSSQTLQYELDYLARGLSWDASYTIIVADDSTNIDMNSWIHIHNASGVEFTKAMIRIAEGQREDDRVVYNFVRPITLPDLSSKNVEWFTALDVPTTQSYRIYSSAHIHENEEGVSSKPQAEVWLSVENHKNNGLGQPLPAGIITVFQKTADGRVGYMGENKTTAITHGETFSLRLGNSNDILAEVKQTDFRRLSNQVVESGYNVLFTNETDRTLAVSFVQHFEGEWSMLRETHDHQTLAKNSVEWPITLPPHETQTLRFRVRMKKGKTHLPAK